MNVANFLVRNTKPKWATVTVDMAVELEADLNAEIDPTSQFVTQGEKRGTGNVWTCKCCQGTFTGHKCKLTIHITGKKILNDEEMGVQPCNPAVMIKQGNQFVPNTEHVEESGKEAGESAF